MSYKVSLSIFVCVIAFAFSGCETHTVQTTSGKDYLSKYPTEMGSGPEAVDKEVREIANIEPTLRFPARIGLAKLYNGQISNLRPEEVEAWTKVRDELGPEFGEFVPVSSLIIESVYDGPAGKGVSSRSKELLRKVRLGSARQHLDAVLVYEVFSKTKSTTLQSSVANWTIVGAYFIPSEKIETTGYANALLMDVRTGYPYGTASAATTAGESATFAKYHDKKRNVEEANQLSTVSKLASEVKQMMEKLIGGLGSG